MKVDLEFRKSLVKQEWKEGDYHKLWEELRKTAEKSYGDFSAKLLPETKRENVLGIRLPHLREYAKYIAKGDLYGYLNVVNDLSRESELMLEEKLLWAFLIGKITDWKKAVHYISGFIPYIDNWSVNDSFCTSLKIAKSYPEQMLSLLKTYLASDKTYELRFALVMLLNYYIKEDTIDFVLESCNRSNWHGYYVQMAVAWTVSMCYVSNREKTLQFLNTCKLDDFTYHKSLQKIMESLQVTTEEKQFVKSLKRM